MAELLGVASSITGIITAAAKVAGLLGPYVSIHGTAQVAQKVHLEVQQAQASLNAFDPLINRSNGSRFKNASLIKVDRLIAVLTDGVLIFSELESTVSLLVAGPPSSQLSKLMSRLPWAHENTTLTALLGRLQSFRACISWMLEILQRDCEHRAWVCRRQLEDNIEALLESNEALASRLNRLESTVDVDALVFGRSNLVTICPLSETQSGPDTEGLTVEPPLEIPHCLDSPMASSLPPRTFKQSEIRASRLYRRRARRNGFDFAIQSSVIRPGAWSVLSGFNISDISIISAIALPISPEDLSNPEHYMFQKRNTGPEGSETAALLSHLARLRGPIYHYCFEVKEQLLQIQGFRQLFDKVLVQTDEPVEILDPLREILRLGFPLLMLLREVDCRLATWSLEDYVEPPHKQWFVAHFLHLCGSYLGISPADLFSASDLMGDDNLKFLKVVTVLKMLLTQKSQLASRNDVGQVNPPLPIEAPTSDHCEQATQAKENLAQQLVEDEHAFIIQLQDLLSLKPEIELDQRRWADQFFTLFSPVSCMIDLHIRLVLDLEMNLLKPIAEQNWAGPFRRWNACNARATYEAYAICHSREREALNSYLDALEDRPRYRAAHEVHAASRYFPTDLNRPEQGVTFVEALFYAPFARLGSYESQLQSLRSLDAYQEHRQDISSALSIVRHVRSCVVSEEGPQEVQTHERYGASDEDGRRGPSGLGGPVREPIGRQPELDCEANAP